MLHHMLRAAGPSITLSFVDSATSTSNTITIPATAAAGDIAILSDAASTGGGPPASVTPTNWTKILETTDSSTPRSICSYRVLQAGEPGSSITGMDGNTDRKEMIVFRPSSTINSVTVSTPNGEASVGAPSNQVVSASGHGTPLVVIATYRGAPASTVTPSFSPSEDAAVANGADAELRYKLYNSSPADVTVGMTDSGNFNVLQSFYIQLS